MGYNRPPKRDELEPPGGSSPGASPNPKTLTGARKTPLLSVVPASALIHLGGVMRYGAFEAPRVDGTKGYGPFNWRNDPIEAMTYVDAVVRHLFAWVDGEDLASDSQRHHLAHAMASPAIVLDAIEHGTLIDNRPLGRKSVASLLLQRELRKE